MEEIKPKVGSYQYNKGYIRQYQKSDKGKIARQRSAMRYREKHIEYYREYSRKYNQLIKEKRRAKRERIGIGEFKPQRLIRYPRNVRIWTDAQKVMHGAIMKHAWKKRKKFLKYIGEVKTCQHQKTGTIQS